MSYCRPNRRYRGVSNSHCRPCRHRHPFTLMVLLKNVQVFLLATIIIAPMQDNHNNNIHIVAGSSASSFFDHSLFLDAMYSRNVELSNESGQRLIVNWNNNEYNNNSNKNNNPIKNKRKKRPKFSQLKLKDGQRFSIKSYVNQTFSFRVDDETTANSKNNIDRSNNDNSCITAFATIDENFGQVVRIQQGLQIIRENIPSTALPSAVEATIGKASTVLATEQKLKHDVEAKQSPSPPPSLSLSLPSSSSSSSSSSSEPLVLEERTAEEVLQKNSSSPSAATVAFAFDNEKGEESGVVLAASKTQELSISDSIVEKCRQRALDTIATFAGSPPSWSMYDSRSNPNNKNPIIIMEELQKCIETSAVPVLEEKIQRLAIERKRRLDLSEKSEWYTCADHRSKTTPAKEMRTWTTTTRTYQYNSRKNNMNGVFINNTITQTRIINRSVHILHEHHASQIHMIENFISRDECMAIQAVAEPMLHYAAVADGKGGASYSIHRRAMEAGIEYHHPRDDDDGGGGSGDQNNKNHAMIAQVIDRLYDYANYATGYNLTLEGQEDLMSIQYFGKDIHQDSTRPPDQYLPHCDGDCRGLPHKKGSRVATMVMYCDVPILGGGTNFQNSGVYVQPKVGAAAFFSYMDSETQLHDTGFTTHSGCPVIEGTKRIAVQWLRVGVNEQSPWYSFDTSNNKRTAGHIFLLRLQRNEGLMRFLRTFRQFYYDYIHSLLSLLGPRNDELSSNPPRHSSDNITPQPTLFLSPPLVLFSLFALGVSFFAKCISIIRAYNICHCCNGNKDKNNDGEIILFYKTTHK